MGGFSANAGSRETKKLCAGKFIIGKRIKRGKMLIFFPERYKVTIMYTIFRNLDEIGKTQMIGKKSLSKWLTKPLI